MTVQYPRIAIVDDDPSVLRALARLLRAGAYRSVTYQSAKEFLLVPEGEKPDCLIVDLQMPGMSGFQLHEHLTLKGILIPTIMITADAKAGVRERCAKVGIAAFLVKPLHEESLFAAIEGAIRNPSR